MEFSRAQEDVRLAYLNGSPGMFVSGVLWLAAAALAQRGDVTRAMVVLFVGGMFIFPASALLTRALGGAATLPKGHPMLALAPGSTAACAWTTAAIEVSFAGIAMTQWRARRGMQPDNA